MNRRCQPIATALVANPRHGAKATARLQAAQQAVNRCERGSKRRRKAVESVARLHRKVRRQSLNHAHKTALGLIREHDFIAHEDLKIRNEQGPRAEARSRTVGQLLAQRSVGQVGLNRSIADAGWECSSRSSPPRQNAPDGK